MLCLSESFEDFPWLCGDRFDTACVRVSCLLFCWTQERCRTRVTTTTVLFLKLILVQLQSCSAVAESHSFRNTVRALRALLCFFSGSWFVNLYVSHLLNLRLVSLLRRFPFCKSPGMLLDFDSSFSSATFLQTFFMRCLSLGVLLAECRPSGGRFPRKTSWLRRRFVAVSRYLRLLKPGYLP